MRRAFRDLTGVEADGAATRARVLAGAGRDIARRERLRASPCRSPSRRPSPSVRSRRRWQSYITGTRPRRHDWIERGHRRQHRELPPPRWARGSGHPRRPRRPRRSRRPTARPTASHGLARPRRSPRRGARVRPRAPGTSPKTHPRALSTRGTHTCGVPHGAFAPEAAYNRAICLVRLERRDAAARALGRDRRHAARQLPPRRGAATARLAGRARYQMNALLTAYRPRRPSS